MTKLVRNGIPTVKKTVSTSEAPVWKSYLAIRSSSSSDVFNASNTADLVNKRGVHGNFGGRKRAKPSTGRGGVQGASVWMTLATPLTTRQSNREDGAAVLGNIRHYWEQLSVNERQQILFLDEPEQVKQLYKLNLSLLCVGLMQRHLKTSNRTGVASDKKIVAVSVSMATKTATSTNTPVVQKQAATLPPTREVSDMSSEKTYELLEAMEFMDISTGILTVKTELAEDTDRLFTLVGDVLEGFLTSIHVLTESNFNKLFVAESETINTWVNYQRLIAMLVEQLILRSYVSHLERKAAQQMEQLLLEVSLEDKNVSTSKLIHYGKKKAKKKKRKSTRHGVPIVRQTDKQDTAKCHNKEDTMPEGDDSTAPSSRDEVLAESVSESVPEPNLVSADSDCGSMMPTESIDEVMWDVNEGIPEGRTCTRKLSSLNPNALIFQPQEPVQTTEDNDARTPSVGKRKLDEYIVNVPWEDVDSDVGSAFDNQSIDRDDRDLSDGEEEIDDRSVRQQWRRKQRRREEDAELEWQLQQVYASTSSLFGWDFSRQCKLPDASANLPWSESMLWRTAPKEVVRYFSPGNGDEYSRFHAPHFLPPASRYYFKPGPSTSFGSPLLPVPGLEPSLDDTFGFQPSMVVSSPDFFNAQYHSSNHDEQVND